MVQLQRAYARARFPRLCQVPSRKGPGGSDAMDAPLHLDVLAALRYLRKTGAKVSVVGSSMGGAAAADLSIASLP